MPSVGNVQVRGVPEDIHRRLKAQAALAGQSLNEYLLAWMKEMARVPTAQELARLPTAQELAARMREREPYTGPSTADVIREERDRR